MNCKIGGDDDGVESDAVLVIRVYCGLYSIISLRTDDVLPVTYCPVPSSLFFLLYSDPTPYDDNAYCCSSVLDQDRNNNLSVSPSSSSVYFLLFTIVSLLLDVNLGLRSTTFVMESGFIKSRATLRVHQH